MKKALVILILLAFVGGGLFAQTIQWNGNFNAGLGIRSTAGHDDLAMGLVTPSLTQSGPRLRLQFRYTNAAGRAGIDTTLQSGMIPSEWTSPGATVPTATGWITFADNMLRVQAGRFWGSNTPMTHFDWMNGGADDFSGYGMYTTVYPVPTLRLGFGFLAPASINEGRAWDDNAFTAHLGARLALAGLFNANANLRINHDTTNEVNAINTALSFSVPALPLTLSGAIWINRLDSFDERGSIDAYLDVATPYGMIQDDLRLGLFGRYQMSSTQDDPIISAVLFGEFRGVTNVMLRGEVGYALGADFSDTHAAFGNWGALFRRYGTYNPDHSFLHIKPSVQFRAAAGQQIEVGAFIVADTGNVISVRGATEQGTTFGAYAQYSISF